MRLILRICREHGQPPSWWDSLPRGDQALLLGVDRLEDEEAAIRARHGLA